MYHHGNHSLTNDVVGSGCQAASSGDPGEGLRPLLPCMWPTSPLANRGSLGLKCTPDCATFSAPLHFHDTHWLPAHPQLLGNHLHPPSPTCIVHLFPAQEQRSCPCKWTSVIHYNGCWQRYTNLGWGIRWCWAYLAAQNRETHVFCLLCQWVHQLWE